MAGGRALALPNRTTVPRQISVTWEELRYPNTLETNLHDLWSQRDLTSAQGVFTATVPGHGIAMATAKP